MTVKQPILNDKFEIIGGNHTGIFISKVNKTCEVVTGDQIKEVRIFESHEQILGLNMEVIPTCLPLLSAEPLSYLIQKSDC